VRTLKWPQIFFSRYFRHSRPSNYLFLGSKLTEKTQIKSIFQNRDYGGNWKLRERFGVALSVAVRHQWGVISFRYSHHHISTLTQRISIRLHNKPLIMTYSFHRTASLRQTLCVLLVDSCY